MTKKRCRKPSVRPEGAVQVFECAGCPYFNGRNCHMDAGAAERRVGVV